MPMNATQFGMGYESNSMYTPKKDVKKTNNHIEMLEFLKVANKEH